MYAASLQRYYIPVVLAICTYALKLFILIFVTNFSCISSLPTTPKQRHHHVCNGEVWGKLFWYLSSPPLSDIFAKLIITETKVSETQPSDEMTSEQSQPGGNEMASYQKHEKANSSITRIDHHFRQ